MIFYLIKILYDMAKKENETLDLLDNNTESIFGTGSILGAGQILAGLLSASNVEVPESNITDQLKNLSREVRQRSAVGLDPGQKTIAENNIKNIQQNEIALIKDLSGGSVDVALANVAASTKRTHDALSSLAIKDAELIEQKQLNADNIALKAIASEEKEHNRTYQRYLQNEDAISNMVGAGVSNIVGESKLRKTNEQLKSENDLNSNIATWQSLLGIKDKTDANIEKAEDVEKVKEIEVTSSNIYDIIDKGNIPGA